MKKLLSLILALTFVLSLCPFSAFASSYSFKYKWITDGTDEHGGYYVISEYTGNLGVVDETVWPSEYSGYPVKGIGDRAFYQNESLTKLVIPDFYTHYGEFIFAGCRLLSEVVFPEGFTEIPDGMFSACSNLKEIDIPETVTSINYCSFAQTGLIEVELPSGLTSIAPSTFERCPSLKGIKIPDKVTSIGYYAFSLCKSLEWVEFPPALETIEETAFGGCEKLAEINLPNTVTSIGRGAFYGTAIIDFDMPDLITAVPEECFHACIYLEEIDLHEGITEIGINSFGSCVSLKNLHLPTTVTKISEHAYRDSGLTSVIIPETVKHIGYYAFVNCENLKSVYIPSTVETMDDWIIGYNLGLETIHCQIESENEPEAWNSWRTNYPGEIVWGYEQPEYTNGLRFDLNVEENYYSVVGYQGNETDIMIPYEIANIPVKAIANSAFSENEIIETVTIPDSVEYIGDGAFNNCINLTEIKFVSSPSANAKSSVSLIEGSLIIGEYAFANCRELASLELPENVVSIGANAFLNCTLLTEINLPKALKEIGESAFSGCMGLTEIVIPKSVEIIGTGAFSSTGIEKIYCGADSAPQGWAEDWNSNCNANVEWSYSPLEKGDINGDAKINGADYLMLKSHIFGNLDVTKYPEGVDDRADYNGDGKVNSSDYFILKREILNGTV